MDWWEYLQGLQQDYIQGIQGNLTSGLNWWQKQTGGDKVGRPMKTAYPQGGSPYNSLPLAPNRGAMTATGRTPPGWSPDGKNMGVGIGTQTAIGRTPPGFNPGNPGAVAGMGGGANVGNGQGTGQALIGNAGGGGRGTVDATGRTPPGWVPTMNGQQTGGQIVITPLQRGEKTLDNQLGEGWSKQFAAQHGGMSPIQFYGNAFQQIQDPEQRMGAAINAAINDANFQPGWIREWQKVHGGTEIPQEAWERAWWQAQNGGANFGQGAGINPWGVY